jgi:hypothetical protein
MFGIVPRGMRAVIFVPLFPILTSLLLPMALFFLHRVLPGNELLLFACVYRGLSRAFVAFVTEKCPYTGNKIALFK